MSSAIIFILDRNIFKTKNDCLFIYLFRRSAKYVMDSENTSFLQDMRPDSYFHDGNFNFTKFAADQMHWSGVLCSNASLLWRYVS